MGHKLPNDISTITVGNKSVLFRTVEKTFPLQLALLYQKMNPTEENLEKKLKLSADQETCYIRKK